MSAQDSPLIGLVDALGELFTDAVAGRASLGEVGLVFMVGAVVLTVTAKVLVVTVKVLLLIYEFWCRWASGGARKAARVARAARTLPALVAGGVKRVAVRLGTARAARHARGRHRVGGTDRLPTPEKPSPAALSAAVALGALSAVWLPPPLVARTEPVEAARPTGDTRQANLPRARPHSSQPARPTAAPPREGAQHGASARHPKPEQRRDPPHVPGERVSADSRGQGTQTSGLGPQTSGLGTEASGLGTEANRSDRPRATRENGAADLQDWAEANAKIGVPARALTAYVDAARVMRRRQPDCGISWTVLAGVGKVESNHGRYGGAQLTAGGETSEPIIGIPLDGHGVAAIPDTDNGELDGDPIWDRAVGPMQFIPTTWADWARDGNGDNVANPHNIDDAALSAAAYLCGGDRELDTDEGRRAALFVYNHASSYATKVLEYANTYARRSEPLPDTPR